MQFQQAVSRKYCNFNCTAWLFAVGQLKTPCRTIEGIEGQMGRGGGRVKFSLALKCTVFVSSQVMQKS